MQRSFGYYVSGDYQLGRRWFAVDASIPPDRANACRHRSRHLGSPHLLAQRVQPTALAISFHSFCGGEGTNELLMQVQFSFGAHGAHPF